MPGLDKRVYFSSHISLHLYTCACFFFQRDSPFSFLSVSSLPFFASVSPFLFLPFSLIYQSLQHRQGPLFDLPPYSKRFIFTFSFLFYSLFSMIYLSVSLLIDYFHLFVFRFLNASPLSDLFFFLFPNFLFVFTDSLSFEFVIFSCLCIYRFRNIFLATRPFANSFSSNKIYETNRTRPLR